MPYVFDISVDGVTTRLIGSCDNYYVLSAGEFLDLQPWPAWCAACGRFTEAERFEAVEWYDQQIATAEYYATHPGLIPPDAYSTQVAGASS